MLQRAASNAYSWWWASHVRTKQSKWLEQSLQDMGDKVESVLKLITQDGDSFAKRAEMYYKHRPELISFVEESFRAYQSLAERYDYISKELQNANSTLASAFPDQYQFQMDDDDDYSPRVPRKFQMAGPPNPNIPTAPVPKFPTKNIKAIMALTSKNNAPRSAPKSGGKAKANKVPKSGLTKNEAADEIDKLQKKILTLQTEKEFAKSSYENGYNKYWNIEEEIEGMQQNISKLQDEFQIAQSIDDSEARTLMAEAAIKSCQETLAQLQEKQEKAAEEAKAERQRIKDARNKLRTFKSKLAPQNETDASEIDSVKAEENRISFGDEEGSLGEPKELEMLRDKIKEHFDVGATSYLTVSEMAEKIDELVNKVINLETAVSSQTALIHRLRSEADELQSHVKILEDDKANLMEGKEDLNGKVCEMEKKLKGLQELDRSFRQQSSSLETHFSEARSNLDTISKKLCDMKLDEEVEEPSPSFGKGGIATDADVKTQTVQDIKENDAIISKTDEPSLEEREQKTLDVDQSQEVPSTTQEKEEPVTLPILEPLTMEENTQQMASVRKPELQPVTTTHTEPINPQGSQQEPATLPILQPVVPQEVPANVSPVAKPVYATLDIQPTESVSMREDGPPSSPQPQVQRRKEEDEPDWQQLFTKGLEGKEKVLLQEYTSILRNYKEAKKRLNEMEKKSQEDLSGIEAQLTEMRNHIAMKDEEIHTLRQKLHLLQKRFDEYKNSKEKDVMTPVRNEEPEEYEDIGVPAIQEREISAVEQKLRADIDEILEENLDFWLRFSSSFGQIQKFQDGVQDLFSELAKLEKGREKKDGSTHGSTHGSTQMKLKSDVRPIYKHLLEIETELTVWLGQSEKLKEELQRRFSQLCNIQEEINHAVNVGAEDDEMIFTSYQAAKFQGELANMLQENNKVADELQAGMDHITSLQLDVERTITRLNDDLGLSGSKSQNENQASGNKARVPLRSFIFGVKPQKKKQSIFSCMHPAMMQRRYQHPRADKAE